ncbi:LptF/LptG family permease [Flexithrix dorotheae]|uniref:LptF/LptG family permease n=1 Tax=Flexithrix dorotheae TaxID=70993 RepID=UPI00037F3152|nr:LptF/LptG family permease [Flexithrix dorotheae]
MLKKLDKLIFKVFYGPFFLTFAVVLFIFLSQTMIKNFKHFVGKGLGFEVYAELFFYFALVLTPVALPLAVLLASLMTFGSLGEHSELTAIKSAGISLPRILRPVSIYIVFVTIAAFYFNDQVAPYANLKAYSLLYDVKQKKPTLEFKPKIFYYDLPGYRIKIDRKLPPNDELLEGIMIYNHTDRKGNIQVIMAERGTMKMVGNFLELDLENGNIYSEESAKKRKIKTDEYFRQTFKTARFRFSMDSYGFKETKEDFFKGHNLMKTTSQLLSERDSVNDMYWKYMNNFQTAIFSYYSYWEKDEDGKNIHRIQPKEEDLEKDEEGNVIKDKPNATPKLNKPKDKDVKKPNDKKLLKPKKLENKKIPAVKANYIAVADSSKNKPNIKKAKETPPIVISQADKEKYLNKKTTAQLVVSAKSKAQSILNVFNTNSEKDERQKKIMNGYQIDIYRNFTKSFAVFAMFLIGAPLGAIIKKGGLGVPVLISIVFFVIFYISTIMGEKYAKEMLLSPLVGCWAANTILLCFGLFFLRQARRDARLFDTDFYYVVYTNLSDKIKSMISKKDENKGSGEVKIPQKESDASLVN